MSCIRAFAPSTALTLKQCPSALPLVLHFPVFSPAAVSPVTSCLLRCSLTDNRSSLVHALHTAMTTQANERRGPAGGEQSKDEMAADQSASTILLPLPQPLLTLVLQFLDLSIKRTQLTRLHRSFPPLQPAAFAFDCLSFTPQLRAAWHLSSRLQQLLSGVRAVLFLHMDVVHRAKSTNGLGWQLQNRRSANHHPSTPLTPAPSSFALAQQMVLRVRPYEDDPAEGLLCKLFGATTSGYDNLHSLHAQVVGIDEVEDEDKPWSWLESAFVSPLQSLPSLRTLQISGDPCGTMHWAAFRLLLSLPLVHLDRADLHVDLRDMDITAWQFIAGFTGSEKPSLPMAGTWRVLKLPGLVCNEDSRGELLCGILQQCMDGKGELQRISLEGHTRDAVACSARLSKLQSLELYSSEQFIDVEPLLSATPRTPSSPALPVLRHVCIICHSVVFERQVTEAEIIRCAQQYVDLLRCHSAQLVCLELHDILVYDSCAPLLQAVFGCSQLRRCSIRQTAVVDHPQRGYPYRYHSIPPVVSTSLSVPPLPLLHELSIALPLSADELAAVLVACPAVQDLSLDLKVHGREDVMSALQMLKLSAGETG